MKSERSNEKSAGSRVALFGAMMGLALLFSLGVMGRQAAGSKGGASAAVESARRAEAAAATGEINDIPVQHVPGHPEFDLQLD
jgi:hypothetical protein